MTVVSQHAFTLHNVGLRHNDCDALRRVDISIRYGERVAIIGPSGAGKSSLIGLLNGTHTPTCGRVTVLGHDLADINRRDLRDVRRRIGTIHQQFDLVDQLRVVNNVNAGRLGNWPLWKALLSLLLPRGIKEVRAALERVGIAEKLHARTGNLSGGEQQRVAIARVLVQKPTAVLADEPVASLDPARGKEIINLLHDISEETGTTLIASLHDVDMALDRFERVVGLRGGSVVFDKNPVEITSTDVAALYSLDMALRSA